MQTMPNMGGQFMAPMQMMSQMKPPMSMPPIPLSNMPIPPSNYK